MWPSTRRKKQPLSSRPKTMDKVSKAFEKYISWKEGGLYKKMVERNDSEANFTYRQKLFKAHTEQLNMLELFTSGGILGGMYILWKIWQPYFDPKYYWKTFTVYAYPKTLTKEFLNLITHTSTYLDAGIKLTAGTGLILGATGCIAAIIIRHFKYKPMYKSLNIGKGKDDI